MTLASWTRLLGRSFGSFVLTPSFRLEFRPRQALATLCEARRMTSYWRRRAAEETPRPSDRPLRHGAKAETGSCLRFRLKGFPRMPMIFTRDRAILVNRSQSSPTARFRQAPGGFLFLSRSAAFRRAGSTWRAFLRAGYSHLRNRTSIPRSVPTSCLNRVVFAVR